MNPKVLIVDDEEKVRKYMSRLLKHRGFEVDTAPDGAVALSMIGERDVDIVLLDILMPGIDGITVLKEIKKTRPAIEVIMLTGNASVETAIEGMQLGAFDYLLKPVDLDNLYRCLKEAIEQKKLGQNGTRTAEKSNGPEHEHGKQR
jgi:DNA-binding NtrC family response regulator